MNATALVALICLPPLSAQGGLKKPPGPASADDPATTIDVVGPGASGGVYHNDDGSLGERILPPEELEARREAGLLENTRGDHFCTPMVALRPRRLAPGQSGELYVMVSLTEMGKAVVLPGSHIRLVIQDPTGPLIYGATVLEPAKPGLLPTKFLGKPVYDDSLVFRVPVTVRADAKSERYAVPGVVELEFHRVDSGVALGKFSTALTGAAWIGSPLPAPRGVPAVKVPATEETGGVTPGGTKVAAGSTNAVSASRTEVERGVMDTAAGTAGRGQTSGGTDPMDRDPIGPEDGGVGGDTLLWGSLIVVVLVLFTIRANRK